ncbi:MULTISPECIES: NAD-dependent malic enzyme [unclassified Acinetobacter]|uniref:NAD-dependent malic enzyme n=1 Tax=unclassified Acinetobacter TaxID=196816 RepID=UPI002934F089|nr:MULTISPECIES: NAD-dependent malic enzyme [unclassified Acinetobacter]WOE31435.1 NAD-dependent malic enzyme [Acinetobacter sp. SAAs470]WOE39631.1 NAD-dependent malic enzyme [Acinetobacter sp. SAAs474]
MSDNNVLLGEELLNNAILNRGTAFSIEQRKRFGLLGLLPEKVETEEEQLERVMFQVKSRATDLDRYIYLAALHDTDEVLYFKALMSDPAYFMPLVYTPTVGEACQNYDKIMRRPRGLYLPITRQNELDELLGNWYEPDVRFIVVTDGERILGLGDQGIGGMGIPIGKLSLYTACAGVPPHVTLPITLDVGTNNQGRLNGTTYLGLKQPRVTGPEYDDFIEAFIQSVQRVFPKACIQFEDFAFAHAAPILAKYRDKVCCFNDDIQGTAAVALAGIQTALRITQQPLTEQRILFFGAGTAAVGIATLLVKALMMNGLSEAEARQHCWMFDVHGLLQSQRQDLADFQQPFAHEHHAVENFVDAIHCLKPTAIIGVSTVGKAFNQAVIEAMAQHNSRPIILPFSNPTEHSECSAEDAYTWSKGQAIFASGSPFPPVHFNNQLFMPGQGNNVYIFPAMGMAIYVTGAKFVTDEMFIVAAKALSEEVSSNYLDLGLIFPPQQEILPVSLKVAAKIAAYIFDHGLATVPCPEDIDAYIGQMAYQPTYPDME